MDRKRGRTLPIDQHVHEHRRELEGQKNEVPVLLGRVRELEARAAECTSRRTLRLAKDLSAQADALRERARRLEANEHVQEFERAVVPYMDAYARNAGMPKRRAVGASVPGEARAPFETCDAEQSQARVVDEYLAQVQRVPPKPRIDCSDVCPSCPGGVRMVLVPARALLACPQCGVSSVVLDATSQNVSYDENVEMVSFTYQRCSHFADWIANSQGLEAYRVPQEVVDACMQELYRQRVTSLDDITTHRVREILKSMRLRRCYDHTPQICSRITGRPPLRLPSEASEMCRLMFAAIQLPFQRYAWKTRKNFLSYSYVFARLLTILGYDDLCASLTQLKGRDKLQKMDTVWKLICEDPSIDWPYYPAIS